MSAIRTESKRYFAALGAYIAQLRKAHGMTQAELSRAIGVSQQAVFAYKWGERRTSVLVIARLAKLFGTSTDELIGMSAQWAKAGCRRKPFGTRSACRRSRGRISGS